MSFSHLGLSDKVLAAVAATGYTTPTPIQEQAIPHVLARRDVLGIAQTGTGKTAAFVLPMLTMLEKGRARARMPRTLILEPTRELAAQVKENFDKYGAGHKLNVALLIGGVSFGDQDTKLTRGVDVLIATPGRLLDHTERGGLLLTGVELLVIDEADRMLDMGFIPDIERICKMVPFTRQTLFFSATMPPEIRRITEAVPAQSRADRSLQARHHRRRRVPVPGRGRPRAAREARDAAPPAARRQGPARTPSSSATASAKWRCCHKSLQKHGFSVGALHGDMDQSARTAGAGQFRKGEIPLLVASDVAARGLDIPAVSHVFNFDVPHHADDYVHRIGRTGRAGRAGTAISIVTPLDQKSMVAIEKLIGQTIPQRRRRRSPRQPPEPRRKPTAAESAARAAQPRRFTRRPHKPRRERERKPTHEKREPRRANGGRESCASQAAIGPQSAAARRGVHPAGQPAALAHAVDRPRRSRAGASAIPIGARRSFASSGVPAAAGSRPGLIQQGPIRMRSTVEPIGSVPIREPIRRGHGPYNLLELVYRSFTLLR